ncbi:hypothetical protein CACET_c15890 [Clostridium aceticum]|uniref:WYL domain-containing protein n=1 Tax=Clostridium aceticum TaxID=84022 RepID=A0A0G3W9L5_9CLOT|nr:hypothetical protein [Clostridium aceticum]AKL95038.1 hypothetical protein CACET_c15890 [Clostridium aceticum]
MVDFSLKYSLENKVPVTIMYQKGLEITQRRIKVLKIEDNKIIAYCFKRRANRIFKKDSILAATIVGIQENYIRASRTTGV